MNTPHIPQPAPETRHADPSRLSCVVTGIWLGVVIGLSIGITGANWAIKTAPSQVPQAKDCVMPLVDRAGHAHDIVGPCVWVATDTNSTDSADAQKGNK